MFHFIVISAVSMQATLDLPASDSDKSSHRFLCVLCQEEVADQIHASYALTTKMSTNKIKELCFQY